ncbi:MAG: helix-turn-helix domain-containing protein [Rubrivivax sp.]
MTSNATPSQAGTAGRLPAQPFFTSPEQRVALARDRYFEHGERPSGLVSETVLQSWTRCMGARRDPARSIEFDPISRRRIHATVERSRDLLRAAAAPLARLEQALAGSGCRVLLTDAAGVQVRAPAATLGEGEPVLRCAARVGVSLDEAQVGTNAPGLVLKTMAPIVVLGAEHYFFNTGALRCAAAPIRNGRGRLAGVLDLTIEGRPFGFDAAALVGLYATLIENETLWIVYGPGARARDAAAVVRFQVCPSLLEGSMQALAGIDALGRVAWSNGAAQRLLGMGTSCGDAVEPLLGVALEGLLSRAGAAAMPLPLPNGLTVWAQVAVPGKATVGEVPAEEVGAAATAPPATPGPAAGESDSEPTGAPAAATPTLQQHTRQTIQRVVEDCGGNLSAAARRLGVSRGLLYRRLRE